MIDHFLKLGLPRPFLALWAHTHLGAVKGQYL